MLSSSFYEKLLLLCYLLFHVFCHSNKCIQGDHEITPEMFTLIQQMLVTTPEKWDVVTRKSTGDVALAQLVKMLIIDEVHLLHDDRGSVIESLVARTLRQVGIEQFLQVCRFQNFM